MDFQKLAELYEELEKTSSGNKMREILADFFKKAPEDDIAIVSYLTLGRIASDYEGLILGLAEKSALKAIGKAAGVDEAKVRMTMQEVGDAGLTAEKLLQKRSQTLVPPGKLTIKELFEKLHKITKTTGAGSQEEKVNILVNLLQKSSPKGAKYIIRITLGTLRIGAADMTVLDALAIAYTGSKEKKAQLEKAYNICPDVGIIAETLAKKELKGIEKIDVHVGRPIKMMLAQRVGSLAEVHDKIPGKLGVEAKYDGERIQAHKTKDGKVTLFSRRMDTITEQYPDVVKYIQEQVSGKELVIEGEVIAIDKDGKPLHFQTLMQRKRKTDIEEYVKKVPVQLKVFDLLYYNGKSFLHEPYKKRFEQLEKILNKNKHIMFADRIVTDDVEEVKKFFQKMLKEKQEGIMIKGMDSEYQAGTRGWNWIKWKKEYHTELTDTFDLVIIGAFYGKGKRSGTFGALLCASYNEKDDTFETVTKLGTGLTDEMLAELPKKLKKYQVDHKPARVVSDIKPEVWFEPAMVVEVLAAEITQSPSHALGLALRFPRFVKLREDKKAEQATTSKEIKQMYNEK